MSLFISVCLPWHSLAFLILFTSHIIISLFYFSLHFMFRLSSPLPYHWPGYYLGVDLMWWIGGSNSHNSEYKWCRGLSLYTLSHPSSPYPLLFYHPCTVASYRYCTWWLTATSKYIPFEYSVTALTSYRGVSVFLISLGKRTNRHLTSGENRMTWPCSRSMEH